jgi:hypothetical protein
MFKKQLDENAAFKVKNPLVIRKYGNNNVFITVDCFKRSCMRSKSAGAERARSYPSRIAIDKVPHADMQLIDGMALDIQHHEEIC